uniref:RING-type E3 ubiquitin transferase n=1 Tax=Kalanchoe fedtschenkoi TaxID=63787 RepID=A0A7N0SV54_KALFE
MDEYSGRRGVDGLAAPKRASSIVARDLSRDRDRNSQSCNRIGSSSRLNPARSTQNVGSDKTKISKSSSRWSAHGKEVAGNSSKVVPRVTNPVKPLRSLRNKAPLSSETDSSASRGDVRQAEVANLIPASEGANRQSLLDQKGSESAQSTLKELRSTSVGPNTRPVKRTFLKKPASAADSNRAGSSESVPRLLRQNASATRPGSRSLRGSSAPNPVPSDSASLSRKQTLKKRSSEGESSSSSRAKQLTIAESTQTPSSRIGISVSDTRQARTSQTSLRDNNFSASVRSRRLLDTSAARLPPQTSRRELQQMPRLQNSLSSIGYPHRPHSFSSLSTTESSHRRNLTSPSGAASARNLINREGFRHYHNSRIAEVLLALGRIEQDDEMSFEQLLALESNLILGGLSFHDQHRDMRLDIDDMSYEELLALEERMGSVSTALSEEALAKCVHRSVYKPESSEPSFSDDSECQDDTRCSICQEEYVIGDEMGRLHCKHMYHVDCIDQWLRQKNWCPICKSSAASSSSS